LGFLLKFIYVNFDFTAVCRKHVQKRQVNIFGIADFYGVVLQGVHAAVRFMENGALVRCTRIRAFYFVKNTGFGQFSC